MLIKISVEKFHTLEALEEIADSARRQLTLVEHVTASILEVSAENEWVLDFAAGSCDAATLLDRLGIEHDPR